MPALTPPEQIVKGYKATDKNMRCRGYQFELGVWHKHEGDLIYCDKGFHFCTHQSGPWCYYIAPGTRIWEVEAREVELHAEPGAAEKHVARYIKFIREISVSGNWNTGHSNTGDSNTGDRNTGDRNTGDRNTGDSNTGDRNTGDRNTGDWNTGSGNAGDNHAGHFNTKPEPVYMFDRPVKRGVDINAELVSKLVSELAGDLSRDTPFDATPYLGLPNATVRRIEALHRAHIAARNAKRQ